MCILPRHLPGGNSDPPPESAAVLWFIVAAAFALALCQCEDEVDDLRTRVGLEVPA